MKKVISIIILLSIIISSSIVVFAGKTDNEVVSLGQDLTQEQKQEMLEFFGANEDVKVIEVTNQEEREYFGDYIDESLIGSKAISSVYVEKLPEGEGITVEKTDNITWVTEDMYKNACVTAGIEDAKIIVACPMKASGTAALTGVLKAFEDITGEEISEEEKSISSEEIAKTAKLGSTIGKEKAQELINNVKMYIIENNIKDENSIEDVIKQVSEDLSIELTQEQIDEIISLMKGISRLDLDIDHIKDQLSDIAGRINEISEENTEIKSLLQRIIDFIVDFFRRIFE
ncbi:DUF1002 domain-containing protein [Schnuerera sp. xch1]|uniref:DUF1002 domain-containing protein n=1 Tax=Schnuerera sp. xch1 TaxID=2874283 RepID=UPI001CBDA79D|nr:DUF1002 domain-containing protein [Schnuerera sp. xch1]MBZ2175211.1 DUF1002 domain-containing protein [Schnuerera sp. xch1]